MTSGLLRRRRERTEDYVQRLLGDWMFEGATDAEIAEWADTSPAEVARIRNDWMLWNLARDVAADVGWTGSIEEMMRDALTRYVGAACKAGTCNHSVCASARRSEALTPRDAMSVHPDRSPRPSEAHRAGNPHFDGAAAVLRGAPGPRNPGGAQARVGREGATGHTGHTGNLS
jgi:hypothetical protein